MKYHIDTVPVWDAYKADCECPLCVLKTQNERNYVDVYLGASYMEPDRRVEVNQRGFCVRHNDMLFRAQNRLGLALMTHTHLRSVIEKQELALRAIESSLGKKSVTRTLLKKPDDAISNAARTIDAQVAKCAICENLEETMRRYVYTLIYMYKHESAFKDAFKASKGFCLPHFAQVISMADTELSGDIRAEFLREVIRLQRENCARLERELEWFTLKFDYRNADKPWGNSEDALERTINKLVGTAI